MQPPAQADQRAGGPADGAGGVGGVFERLFAPRVLRRLYAKELERLDATPGRRRPPKRSAGHRQLIATFALAPGLKAAFGYTVTGADTAAAVGNGEVSVLATPRVLALAERSPVAAVADALEVGATTVGDSVELDYLAPASSRPYWSRLPARSSGRSRAA